MMDAKLPITQHIRYGLCPRPSGHCSLRSQRRICWECYPVISFPYATWVNETCVYNKLEVKKSDF
jgi:hypothetical protein